MEAQNKTAIAALRIALVATAASLTGGLFVWSTPAIPWKIHSWVLGAGAILFAISEIHFRQLISELNTILRRSGYSVWQMEQIGQVIPKFRSGVWRLWNISQILKGIVATTALALPREDLSITVRTILVFGGYSLLCLSLILSNWGRRNFRKVEQWCDQMAAREVEIREKKRLHDDLNTGAPHDFKKDDALRGYTKTAR